MSGGERDNNAKELLTREIRPLFSPRNFLRSPEYTTKKKKEKTALFLKGNVHLISWSVGKLRRLIVESIE